MRRLFISAIIAAVAAAVVEAAAAVVGWTPATWLLPVLPAVAGVVAFLVAGRRRAIRQAARRQTRPRATAARTARPSGGVQVSRSGHVTIVRRSRPAAGAGQADLTSVRVDEDSLARR